MRLLVHPIFKEELAKVRERFPQYRSNCGAVLAALRAGDERALGLFFACRCKRGLQVLKGMLEAPLAQFAADIENFTSPARKLSSDLLCAIGWTDTSAGHQYLVEVLHRSQNPLVRADVLEALAYERGQFEDAVVIPFLGPEFSESEWLSALYALEFKRPDPQLVIPFLEKDGQFLRIFAAQVLIHERDQWHLLEPLLHHPDPMVREEVQSLFDVYKSEP